VIFRIIAGAATALLLAGSTAWSGPPASGGPALHPLIFDALAGWKTDAHAAAFTPFRLSCGALHFRPPPVKPALPAETSLDAACAAALALPEKPDSKTARAFFEAWFTPVLVDPQARFTGYFEPEFQGSLTATKKFSAPLLAWPTGPLPDPFPDRATIEAGAFAGRGLELAWLDPVDAFFVHIQGSARIRLKDGSAMRVGFAGRNGYPFTPIARVLVERGTMSRERASMQSIRAWLADNPKDAPGLMRENRSYIFFRKDEGRPDSDGPLGAQSVPVTAGRSIAVDDTLWPYGLPVWVDVSLPSPKGQAPFRRLMVAQDTGAAIRGAGRADIFVGTGQEAGQIAGRIHNRGHFIVLVPRAEAAK
jgi:membrane-bound lytic murein transglycosylase A